MDPVKFNDTADYQHMQVFGIDGVYATQNIDSGSLPDGYSLYYILLSDEGSLDKISKKAPGEAEHGVFITKEKLSLGVFGSKSLTAEDVILSDREFQMEAFFSTKESIDLQIAQADQKREAQSSKSKSKDKSVAHAQPYNDEQFL